MSIKRIPICEFSVKSSEPVIVEKFGDSIAAFPDLINALSLTSLIAMESTDTVGFARGSKVDEIGLIDALKQLQNGSDGYINGWEYMAGDVGSITLGSLVSSIEEIFFCENFLTSLNIPSASLLDSVMKWIFISQGPGSFSDWHTDPIGSAAWMLMVHGEKLWFVEDKQGIIRPGDLIVIPPGIEHRVENIGDQYNVAISHNWVPKSNSNLMWIELVNGLEKLDSFISSSSRTLSEFHETESVDNLLFGLMMVILHAHPKEREKMLTFIPDRSRRDRIEKFLEKI